MTPEQFEIRARKCSTRQDLEQLKRNALSAGNRNFAQIAHNLLEELFSVRTRRGGGATPSKVTFKGKVQNFYSGKDGFIWLVDQFGLHKNTLYTEYQEFRIKHKSSGFRLAKSPKNLFPAGSESVGNPGHFAPLVNGWYVTTILNHVDKFYLLKQLGYLANLNYPADWNFEIQGGTEALAELQKDVAIAEKLLQELLEL